jgi:two-component system chemotaxis response regulator CheB
MAKVRILVVDDSVVIRKLLTTTLDEVPEFEVVAVAAHGKIALARIAECNPDVVILDVEMPEMDGIETLKQIRKKSPRLPVIMFSTRTEKGAVATIEALTCGASDYVAKPSNVGGLVPAMARVREELVPKILALTGRRFTVVPYTVPAAPPPARSTTPTAPPLAPQASGSFRLPTTASIPNLANAPAAPATAPSSPAIAVPADKTPSGQIAVRSRPSTLPTARGNTAAIPVVLTEGPIKLHRATGPRPPVEIVAIGSSTGGPNALSVMLSQLPAEFPVPIVIVQHMLAAFTRHFAERLATQCRIKIVEAAAGDTLMPGCVYIARGDYHLMVERRAGRPALAMNQDPVENFCRPAVDVLFRSVARNYGSGALAVVLTGMGHDGLTGSGAIRDAGGDVIVQDEASSVVWGMPGFIARAGLASQVIAIDQLALELRRRVGLAAPRAQEAAP